MKKINSITVKTQDKLERMLDIKYGDMSVLEEDLKLTKCPLSLDEVLDELKDVINYSVVLFKPEVDEHTRKAVVSYTRQKFKRVKLKFVFDCSFALDDDNNGIVDVKYVGWSY